MLERKFFILMICCLSCQSEKVISLPELEAYIRNTQNGLYKKTIVNDVTIEVLNKPSDLWVAREIGDSSSSPQIVESLRTKYSKSYYFNLSLSKSSKEVLHQTNNFSQYSELVQTVSFRMADYVTLTTSERDTIAVGDYLLARTYGIGRTTDLIFVFDKGKARKSSWVQFNLNEFGLGTGIQRFRFLTKDLEEIPLMQFNLRPINN